MRNLTGLCELIEDKEPTWKTWDDERMCRELTLNEPEIHDKKKYRIKSRIQTYDIRDSDAL